jgi:putative ABC transport system permease protein
MLNLFSDLARDVRYGLRALRRTPVFSLGAIVTVAVTVGASTAMFSVVYGVLLRQLPYRQAERVFWIYSDQLGRDRSPFNVPDFIDYRESTQTLAGFAGYFLYSANLSNDAAAERIQGLRATDNFFEVLGAHPRLGQLLPSRGERSEAAEAGPAGAGGAAGADRVVVLTEPFWIRRFGADDTIIGQSIRLNGDDYTIIGVLAAGFATPVLDVDFVIPFDPQDDPRRGVRNSLNFILGVGRLRDDVSVAQATTDFNGIARHLQERFPIANARKRGVRLVPAIDGIVGPFRTALLTMFAAVGAVLLIACANLANLMLTRASTRRRDLAVQRALGSSRGTIVRQVLVEALLVSIAGGALGVIIARWSIIAVMALAPTALPRVSQIHAGAAAAVGVVHGVAGASDIVGASGVASAGGVAGGIGIDVVMLLFSLAVSSLTGVLFGVIPAIVSARVDVRDALQDTSRSVTSGSRRIRGLLVSAEVALALVLLIVMAMLAKSFANVQAIDPGFDGTHVLSARLTLPAKRFTTRDAITTFQRALADRVSALPGVTHTAAISLLPLSGLLARVPFTVEGRPLERERVPVAQFRLVSAGYFEAAGIPLKRGRTFSPQDTEHTRPVAVVNEALAAQWLQGLDPIGTRLLVDDNDTGPRPVEIIGIVGNVPQVAIDGGPTWDLYLTYPQIHADSVGLATANMFWIVRTDASGRRGTGAAGAGADDSMNFAQALAREVRRTDADVAASQIRPMSRYLDDAMGPRRFSLTLMAAFAFAALVLAVTGIYAVVAYSISQRTHEIAIRIALGATRSSITRLVMTSGLRFVIIGLIIGIALATATTHVLSAMFFGVDATDAATFVEVTASVAAMAVLACAVPTARLGKLGAATNLLNAA